MEQYDQDDRNRDRYKRLGRRRCAGLELRRVACRNLIVAVGLNMDPGRIENGKEPAGGGGNGADDEAPQHHQSQVGAKNAGSGHRPRRGRDHGMGGIEAQAQRDGGGCEADAGLARDRFIEG
jgi:hypothetical protein